MDVANPQIGSGNAQETLVIIIQHFRLRQLERLGLRHAKDAFTPESAIVRGVSLANQVGWCGPFE